MSERTFSAWWHCIAALPADREQHAYHILRRIWADHTIAGSRSFYRWGSEDNITPALFQNWALFEGANALAPLIRAAGGETGTLKRIRWAYAHEELRHGRAFQIADIMLHFEDESGMGLVVFEAKKLGVVPNEKDVTKLRSYCDLESTRNIPRRLGCFLVSENVADKTRQLCNGALPVVTWEDLAKFQLKALEESSVSASSKEIVGPWIGRSFARYGIVVPLGNSPQVPVGKSFGSSDSYRRINNLHLPDTMRLFLKGSECVEAIWRGEQPEPPLAWLPDEPTEIEIRSKKWQQTTARRLCRWDLDNWSSQREDSWPYPRTAIQAKGLGVIT